MDNVKDLVRYEDRDLIVVFKPAGLAVESRRVSQQDLESILRLMRAENGEPPEIYLIQRLDQPVEGLMVLAKTKKAASALSAELQRGKLKKIYRARVAGNIPAERGTLENWLMRDAHSNRTIVVERNTSNSGNGHKGIEVAAAHADSARSRQNGQPKHAVLSYRKIASDEVEVSLKTGRHHQIRVQLAYAGMPIVGDVKYGGPDAGQLCLTSCKLELVHPSKHKKMTWEADPSWK